MKKILPLLILLAAAISVSSCVDFGGGKLDAFAAEQPIVYIDTEADFIEFTNYASVNPGTRYVLRTDIYLDRYYAEGGRNFSLILNGVSLDGRGHAVVGYRNTSVYAYFVNSVSQDGAIKDLKLVDAVLGTETSAAAAPIGTNAGTVSGLRVSAKIAALNEAGLVYDNSGTVTDCFSASELSAGNNYGALYAVTNTGLITESFACDLNSKFSDDVLSTGGSGQLSKADPPAAATDIHELRYLLLSENAKLGSFVNLYNTDFISEESLKTVALNGYGFYNASAFGAAYPDRNGAGNAIEASAFGSGLGTEEDPYVITSAAQLIYAAYGAAHYMLANDVDLIGYARGESVLGDFAGVLYGNGYALTGLKAPLALSLSGSIEDLYLGCDLDQGVVIGSVSGSIDKVTFDGTAPSCIALNGGTVTETAVCDGIVSAFAKDSYGKVNRVFGYAECFVSESSDAKPSDADIYISGSYQVNGIWNAENVTASVGGSVKATYENVAEYVAATPGKTYNGILSSAGWSYGAAGFAVAQGTDCIVPVIASERLVYNGTPVITVSEKGHTYGKGSAAITHYFTDGNGNTQLEGSSLSRSAVAEVFRTYITSETDFDSFEWYNQAGTAVTDSFVAFSTEVETVYTLNRMDEEGRYLIDVTLSGLLVGSTEEGFASVWTLHGMIVEYLYDFSKISYVIDATDISLRLEKLGLEPDPQNLFGYSGVEMSVTGADGQSLDGIKDVGEYIVTLSVPQTLTANATKIEIRYTVETGSFGIDVADYTVKSDYNGKDGLSDTGAPVYNANVNEITPVFSFENFPYPQATVSYSIVYFQTYSGVFSSPGAIGGAGIYTLRLTVSAPGYNAESVFPVTYYVLRAQRTISPGTINQIYYGDAHPNINLNSDYTYDTGYSRFSPPGNYTVTPRLKPNVSNDNYIDTVFASSFTVLPRSLGTDELAAALKSEYSKTYDGTPLYVAADTSKIGLTEGDPNAYVFTLQYTYDDVAYTAPPEFTDAGEYSMTLKITAVSPAYYDCSGIELSTKVIISKCALTVNVNSYSIQYGAEAPEYAVTFRSYSGGALPDTELLEAQIIKGTHYALSCDYSPGGEANREYAIVFKALSEPGNFSFGAVNNGTLSVGKKYRDTLGIIDSYVYNGSPVAIEYTGAAEDMVFAEGYPQYGLKKADGTNAYLDSAPVNASAAGEKYVLFVSIQESENYEAFEGEFEFVIGKATPSLDLEVYYATSVGSTCEGSIAEHNSYTFDGKSYIICAVADGFFASSNRYTVSFSYKINGVPTVSSNFYIEVSVPARLTEITLEVTPKDSVNYTSKTASFGSFVLSKKPLAVKYDNFTLGYTEKEYSSDDLIAAMEANGVLDASQYVVGYVPGFSLSVSGSGAVMLPGTYELTVGGDDCYDISASVSLTVVPAEITLDFSELLYSVEYGSVSFAAGASSYITAQVSYELGGAQFEKKVVLRISHNTASSPEPDAYDVVSVDPLTVSSVVTVKFNVSNGEDKVIVAPREITVLWEKYFAEHYPSATYDGKGVDFRALTRTYILNCAANAPVFVFEYVLGDGVSAGEHIVAAELDGISADRYVIKQGNSEFEFSIAPRQVRYSVTPVTIYSDTAPPDSYTVVYEAGSEPLTSDFANLVSVFTLSDKFEPLIQRSYYVELSFAGAAKDNYALVKTGGGPELTAVFRDFDPVPEVRDVLVVYTGAAVSIPLINENALPAIAEVSRSVTPADAGRYEVTITVEAPGYNTFETNAVLTIAPARAEMYGTERETKYASGYILGDADIVGVSAAFNGSPVEGSCALADENVLLCLGENVLTAVFTPMSSNFESVTFTYTINACADVSGIEIKNPETSEPIPENGLLVTQNDSYIITLQLPKEWGREAELYVNGVISEYPKGTYVFTEDCTDQLLELRINGVTVYSVTLSVDVAEPDAAEPDTDEKPSGGGDAKPGGSQSGGGKVNVDIDDKTQKTLIIVGASVGSALAAAGIVAVVIVAIKKKKGKN